MKRFADRFALRRPRRGGRSFGALLLLQLLVCFAATGARAEDLELVEAFLRSESRSVGIPNLASTEVPVVGCPQDGQLGLLKAPKTPATTRVLLPQGDGPTLPTIRPRGKETVEF
jgi:hypothetical protein